MASKQVNKSEMKMEFDMGTEQKSQGKPAIASRLEKESQELQKKRTSLGKDEVESKLKEAEERRQAELKKKIETAKEMEGTKGKVDPQAAARDAPPAGKHELPNSPQNAGVPAQGSSVQKARK
jgi:hypothetical protein